MCWRDCPKGSCTRWPISRDSGEAPLGGSSSKRRIFSITISKDNEGWWYGVQDENTWANIKNGPHSHEEFLSMDRKYVEVHEIDIDVYPGQFDARKFRCSKEEMARRVVPFLTLRMRPDSALIFSVECPKEFILECVDMFRRCFSFEQLGLTYTGPESEEFLALQLKNNLFLCGLMLLCWPHTETTEQLLLTFLNSSKKRMLNTAQFPDWRLDQSPLKVTIGIVKAAVDSWVRGDEKRALSVYGPIGVTPAEILLISLPENVTIREEEGAEAGKFRARWTKEDGSSLLCELFFCNDIAVIKNSAGWYDTTFY